MYNKHYPSILVTFLGETEHFSGKNGAFWWSILVGKQKHNVQKPTDIPLQRGPNFNTARRHFESYLAAWPLVHDIKMYNETSGQVTWAHILEPMLPVNVARHR